MRIRDRIIGAGLLAWAASSLCCVTVDGTAKVSGEASDAHEVAWFEGDVDEAFAAAAEEGKALFLYWGAEWCPPCHYLKTKVFRRPEFAAKIRDFIPVYLDGDTERAQILGERFDVLGYPTVIIFTPEGEEVMRMPSDVDVERYVELLDTALNRMRPIAEVLAAVMESGPDRAAPEDLSLLAFYSWGQDTRVEMDDEESLATARTLYERTPDELTRERSRFLSMYLDELESFARRAAEDESDEIVFSLAAAERSSLSEAVTGLLGDRELRNVNPYFVFFGTGVIDMLHPEPSPERNALIAGWDAAAAEIEKDESLSLDDRLTALFPRLELARMQAEPAGEGEEPALPADLVEHVHERVVWAGETVADDSEMQAVMSTMVSLYEETGALDEAEALLQARMDDAHAPYYYMSWMASLKGDADNPEEALVWYRKAYDSSRGRYTRFRWGSTYLRRLIELRPADAPTIREDSTEILRELLTHDDAFAGGNASRLRQLESAYLGWNEDGANEATIAGIRELVHAECERYPADGEDSQRERCTSFLIGAETTR